MNLAKCPGDLDGKPCPQRDTCQRYDPRPSPRQVLVIPWVIRGRCVVYVEGKLNSSNPVRTNQ